MSMHILLKAMAKKCLQESFKISRVQVAIPLLLGKSTAVLPIGSHTLKKILNVTRKTKCKHYSFSQMCSLRRISSTKMEFIKKYGKSLAKLRIISKEYASASGLRIRPEILEQAG